MTFTALFVMIFLVAFVLLGGVVMFLSKTIDHGEARFDASGKIISDERESAATKSAPQTGPTRPATRIDQNKASDNE